MENKFEKTPWTRLNSESSVSYNAFSIYRDMGATRSYSQVVKQLGKKLGYKRQIEKWSRKYQWVYRVSAYDNHLDMLKLKESEGELLNLHKNAVQGAKPAIERLIDIAAYGSITNQEELNGIELLLRTVGLIHDESELKKQIRGLVSKVDQMDLESVLKCYN